MARRGSAMTDISLRLTEDAVDHNGVARLPPIDFRPASDDAAIAPWIDVPPTPLPKSPGRTYFASAREYHRNSRQSESQSTLSITDHTVDEGDSLRAPFTSGSSSHSSELRKSKSSFGISQVFGKLKSRPSRPNLYQSDGGQSSEPTHPSLRNPAPPLPTPYIHSLSDNSSRLNVFSSISKKKKKSSQPLVPPDNVPDATPTPVSDVALDLDLNRMEGIIRNGYLSSPSSGGGSDYGSAFPHQSRLSSSDFKDPFSPSTSTLPLNNRKHSNHISPTTMVLPGEFGMGYRTSGTTLDAANNWEAPESWGVELGGKKPDEPTGDSDSDNERSPVPPPKLSVVSVSSDSGTVYGGPVDAAASRAVVARNHRRPSSAAEPQFYRIRIYRSNGAAHAVTLHLSTTVDELNKELFKKVYKNSERGEQHRLYLEEGGRERILGPSERPATIVKRRLTLNGYEPEDGVELLGSEDQPYLFKFSFKSQLLGPPEEDLNFDNFDFIDLTGRSLRTIPILLHQNADSIISLKLSRNPMLEIPLDFIQSCSTLRELRLSNMAMQKVPQSVRHSTTLHRLDLSSNRIGDLKDAYLDHITGLMTLKVQNNKLKELPWHFGRLRCLHTLNISNNRFTKFPEVVAMMQNLRDLDISFNSITELPETIGQLQSLERLTVLGNQLTRFPNECGQLSALRVLDCRRNQISDLTIMLMLPNIQTISADHNSLPALDLSIGPNLMTLDVSRNDITKLSLVPGPIGRSPYSLTSLNISRAKLSSLDDIALGTLTSLRTLILDHNSFLVIPETLGELSWLETLSVADNNLNYLPQSIGRLQKLEVLDAHHNALSSVPESLWNCASLTRINLTSNHIKEWPRPPMRHDPGEDDGVPYMGRKGSSASTSTFTGLPALVHSLEKLYLGENRLADDVIHPLMIFKELRVLNLSFNYIQDLPSTFFKNMIHLEELYLSGNRLTAIPTEDLPRLKSLTTLYLNGNKLQTLPQELGKVKDLTILDVGSNMLRYNINNWEFDWNWNFNKKLKYLNLSGNIRLQIKAEPSRNSNHRMSRDLINLNHQTLAGFRDLTALRVLGLIDVTITNTSADIPDESDLRRVRTSSSMLFNEEMAYGIADSLGTNEMLNVLDLVHEFPCRPNDPKRAIFAMFGLYRPPKGLLPHTSPNRVAKYLHDNFVNVFMHQLHTMNKKKGEDVQDAMRRTFLKLNQNLYQHLNTFKRKNSQASSTAASSSWMYDPALSRTGASAVVVYFHDKTMYAANVGNSMAVVSRAGMAHRLSQRHDPYDRPETQHIRSAEGYVSGAGLVNDEVDASRSFGHFNLVPIVHAKPHIQSWAITNADEFVIIANRGLWDFIPPQTAVDIAGDVARHNPMLAAQKLRDFAISYGADGSLMIMVVSLAHTKQEYRPPKKPSESLLKDEVRLKEEIDPPIGHLALVFTDIRNSTHLWEVNPGMPTAMRKHNELLRRCLRLYGGYEVKTEGDSFMNAFPTALAAVYWCLSVQKMLLEEEWPLEILECEDGKPIEEDGQLLARGLSVRMGIHCGLPSCEPDPITKRMDYFGVMVNRTARVNSMAKGGQIMVSSDILREINVRVFESPEETESEYSRLQPQQAVDGIRELGIVVVPVGEVKLKGIETPETLAVIYPKGLEGRHNLKEGPTNATGTASRVQFSVPQTKELGLLCLRLEALSGGRLFKAFPERKGSIASAVEEAEEDKESAAIFMANPQLLLPRISEDASDTDLMVVLDSLSVRIENAISALANLLCPPAVDKDKFMHALLNGGELDDRTLEYISLVLQKM